MLPGPNGAISWPTRICLFPIIKPILRIAGRIRGRGGGWGRRRTGRRCRGIHTCGVALRYDELGTSVHLPHTARDDSSSPFLKPGGKLARPKHQVFTLHFGGKFLPRLRILPPLPLELISEPFQFNERSGLILRSLDGLASGTEQLIACFHHVPVSRFVLDR